MLAAGALGGVFYFSLGGWWYRKRLEWCGDRQADAGIAKRVYLFSSQIHAVPAIIVTCMETNHFETPLASAHSEGSLWYLLLMVFPFWSVVASYIGVRTMFELRRGSALVWFGVLPALVFASAMGGVFLALAGEEPDLDHPVTYEGSVLTCEYPRNWWCAVEEADPGNESIMIQGMPDAFVRAMVYESEGTPETEFAISLVGFSELEQWEDGERFDTWAGHNGAGGRGAFTTEGETYEVLLFVWTSGERAHEVQAIYMRREKASIAPVAELVGTTLQLR